MSIFCFILTRIKQKFNIMSIFCFILVRIKQKINVILNYIFLKEKYNLI